MIITDHFEDGEHVGISLPVPAEEYIEVWKTIFEEYSLNHLKLEGGNLIFKTITGEVEYFFMEFIFPDKCKFVLAEDRRS